MNLPDPLVVVGPPRRWPLRPGRMPSRVSSEFALEPGDQPCTGNAAVRPRRRMHRSTRASLHRRQGFCTVKAVTVVPRVAGSTRYEEVPEPDVSTGSILVEAVAVGICRTDDEKAGGGVIRLPFPGFGARLPRKTPGTGGNDRHQFGPETLRL